MRSRRDSDQLEEGVLAAAESKAKKKTARVGCRRRRMIYPQNYDCLSVPKLNRIYYVLLVDNVANSGQFYEHSAEEQQ
jgi:hypoxanthine phosphoribosyltransferase